MTGFMGSDGSALAGGLNPSGIIQGLQVSSLGDLSTLTNIQRLILAGQGFSVSTGKVTAAANMAGQFWVPSSSTKNVLIWSVRNGYSNANQSAQLAYITAQDTNITAGTNDSANVLNLKAGGPAPISGMTLFHAGGVVGPSGTPLDFVPTPFTADTEYLSPGMFILIPAGVAAGLAIYQVTTAAGGWSFTVRFVEF